MVIFKGGALFLSCILCDPIPPQTSVHFAHTRNVTTCCSSTQERLHMCSGCHAAKILPFGVRGTKNVWCLSPLVTDVSTTCAVINVGNIILAGFLITVSPYRPFASNSFFFRPKAISKVAIIKTKSATFAFLFLLLLSFSSLFLFLLSFFFVTMILDLLGLKKPVFWRFFTQMTANFVMLVFKKSARIKKAYNIWKMDFFQIWRVLVYFEKIFLQRFYTI